MKKILKLASLVTALCILLSCNVIGFASKTNYSQGDIITFGTYPQSQVTDEHIISELNKKELQWTDINGDIYVEETDENIDTVIYSYSDTGHNGEKYRAVQYSNIVIKNSSTLTNDTL